MLAFRRQLFDNLDVPLQRTPYAAWGFSLALLKYVGDAVLIHYATGRMWTPLNYVSTLRVTEVLPFTRPNFNLTFALLVWMIPFVWIGVVFTMRRALDAAWSPWWALVFFVPYVNYALMITFCLLPSSEKYAVNEPRRAPVASSFGPNAALGVAAGAVFAVAMVGLAVILKGNYAFGLFIGTPMAMGALTGYGLARGFEPSVGELFATVLVTNIFIAIVLLLVAFEGAICIAMAFPISLVMSFVGGLIGREIATSGRAIRRRATSAMFLVPLLTLIEPAHIGAHQLHVVKSSVEINATPPAVWPHVIEFQPIAPPQELMFRLGIAYPTWSHSDGAGVGATRYCEFSTGSVVERVTVWDPGKRLSFDVESQPPPMLELTPYENLQPPHLRDYVRSKHGEFRLVTLPGGRTRLEGTSWYEIDIEPETYWSFWASASVHAIHMRVFEHIKKEVERQPAAANVSR